MVFYLSLMAGGTPKPAGIESEIRSSAEHAIALGDDREMTWDLLVWACKTMGDSTDAAKYEATRDEKINHGELSLRTQALSNLISGDYPRIDLDNYASEHSLTLALDSKNLVIRGGPGEVKLGVDTAYPNSPSLGVGKAILAIDLFPRKSKNGHWYISEDAKTKVLDPALGNPDLPPKPEALKAYLALWPGLQKEQEKTATEELIREVIAQDPRSFASFSEWKPSTPDAVVIFCTVQHLMLPDFMGKPLGLFTTGLLAQAPVSYFRTQENVDRDLQLSTLLQISFQSALPGNMVTLGTGGDMRVSTMPSQPSLKPDCPTIYCTVDFNQKDSSAEIKRAKNDAKTAFVKGLNDFNTQVALLAAIRQHNAQGDKPTPAESSVSNPK